ncbi:hypothetical protein CHS0354_017053 [Potamilus streckersoni]|uniref:Uncharacterized protein n=1 Tax=Potamilus streckersoni TaxID=2493646 RepID=A0AAE0T004_9BIVA|nr:hypothetical protein CHS0354_017053 [Potamilus streckersoni]
MVWINRREESTNEISGSEIVWLKDVTAIFQTQKQIFSDPDLPDHLTFQVKRGSGVLILNLKRNYEIDPNADIYFVERAKDGRSILSKTTMLEREAIAYYQDVDNGAYMTVKCINSLNQQCERIINGNLQIGDRSYDLRPVVNGDTPAKLLKVTDSVNRIYLLLDQTHLLQENLVANKDLSKENLRQLKQQYYVKIAVLSDSSVWNLRDNECLSEKRSRQINNVYHIKNIINKHKILQTAISGSEIVWLKDVTAIFQTQKRIFSDPDLPDHLTFQVKRGSGVLILNLKRSYEIDPNADIYYVERDKDGRSILSKTTMLESEAIAYYQDVDNGAYMTVKCINSLNQQCERIINGNLQIGDRSYDLRPAVTGDTPAKLLKVTDSVNRIYLLLDQTHLQQENLVEKKGLLFCILSGTYNIPFIFLLQSPEDADNQIANDMCSYFVIQLICSNSKCGQGV